jgi:predicted ATP-dependent serine protease
MQQNGIPGLRRKEQMDKFLAPSNAATGVPGLDEILAGGFARGALFLVEGKPGTGKTTLALRFLIEGASEGERTRTWHLSQWALHVVRQRSSAQRVSHHRWRSGSEALRRL